MQIKPQVFPAMYLFKAGKIYEYNGARSKYTLNLLLDFLSSDNFISLSTVKSENSDLFIKTARGIEGNVIDRIYLRYGRDFENYFTELSKKTFKRIYLGHWD
jgi:hypothetical protein